jgi:exodeoxyribonuclease VII large subunit
MKEIWTVTRLNLNIKNILESNFSFVWVEGEISNLRRPQSGHAYFTLKDENSQIRAVVFRTPFGTRGNSIGFDFEEGMSIICRARISVYQPRGEYQLIIDAVEPKGIGALQKAFEQLKARLQNEGLFDEKHKKPIPFLPRRIGVITSPTGAVIRDILSITYRRFPSVAILISPVRVQGSEAPAEIIRAIENMNEREDVDVIILARGGGSLEDLAPFNDEGVARKIYSSRLPIVSAVGHETDFTIADFVADLRTPTPSAAAEMVVPVRQELLAEVASYGSRVMEYHRRLRERMMEKVLMLEERLRNPVDRIHNLSLFVAERLERLRRAMLKRQDDLRYIITSLSMQVRHGSPLFGIKTDKSMIEMHQKDLINALRKMIDRLKKRLDADGAMLETLSPLGVLKRGYSITKTLPEGSIVRTVETLAVGGDVAVTVSSGSFQARVMKIDRE